MVDNKGAVRSAAAASTAAVSTPARHHGHIDSFGRVIMRHLNIRGRVSPGGPENKLVDVMKVFSIWIPRGCRKMGNLCAVLSSVLQMGRDT